MDNECKGSWVINDNQCLIFYHDFILSTFSYFPCFHFFQRFVSGYCSLTRRMDPTLGCMPPHSAYLLYLPLSSRYWHPL